MDDCIRIVGEGRETHLDILLTSQIKCHIITYQLTCPPDGESEELEGGKVPSAGLFAAMLGQIADIRQNLPPHVRGESKSPGRTSRMLLHCWAY